MTTILSQIEQQPYSLDIAVSRKRELDGKFFGPKPANKPVVNRKSTAITKMCGSNWLIVNGIRMQPDWQLVDGYVGTVTAIKQEVAAKYNVSPADMDSIWRNRQVVQARHEFFWRARRETVASLPDIGRRCGGKDHTTVLNGVKIYESLQRMKAGLEPIPHCRKHTNFDLIIPLEAGE